jgi:hypothetical protein
MGYSLNVQNALATNYWATEQSFAGMMYLGSGPSDTQPLILIFEKALA